MKFIKNLFILAFIFSAYSALSIESYKCRIEGKNTKYCSFSKIVTLPGSFFERGVLHSKILFNSLIRNEQPLLSRAPISTKKRFSNIEPGFTFYYKKGSRPEAGYLLLSKANPFNKGKPAVEIYDLNQQKLVYKYNFTKIKQNRNKKFKSFFRKTFFNKERYIHPLIMDDGALVFNNFPDYVLTKIDLCGNLLFENNSTMFSHSLEKDFSERIYVPTQKKPEELNLKKFRNDFADDGFAILDSDLNIIKEFSLIEIYDKEKLLADLYGRENIPIDPFHINDVEPLLNQNSQTSIVFLSLATQSSLLAYDIDLEKLIWKIDRASSIQHDIDVLNINENQVDISIFDNNYFNDINGESLGNKVIKFSNLPLSSKDGYLLIANPKYHKKFNKEVLDFRELKPELRPITRTEGRSDFIKKNNSLMIEETNHGRLIELDINNGQILWQFVNKSEKNSIPYMLNWSRRLDSIPGIIKNKQSKNYCSKIDYENI